MAELLNELERAQETTARTGRIIESLVAAQMVEVDGPARRAVARHTTPPCGCGWQDGRSDPAAGWRATLAALQADADAPSAVVARAQPVRSEGLANGAHAGLRWYVQNLEGVDAPVVTAIGFVGSTYISDSCEMPDWTEAAVCRQVEDLVAARSAKAGRRAKA